MPTSAGSAGAEKAMRCRSAPVDLLAKHKLGLFGAITSKPKKQAEAELAPELRGKGYSYFSPIVTMRQRFNLDICIRPCISFPGNPLNFIRKKPDGGFEEPLVNVVVFRQNTEGLYAGVEWTNPPEQVRAALATHSKFKPFASRSGTDLAISVRIITRKAARKICQGGVRVGEEVRLQIRHHLREAERAARNLRHDGRRSQGVAKEYPGIALWSTNIDAQTMWLTKNPEDYGVVVASNLFGDVISDAFAGLIGGLGFAASGNIGDEVAVFEPTHGSAPKYAELDPPIVNPIAMFLSAVMMLEHVGEVEKARRIREAIAAVVKEGKVRTYDMMRLSGGAKAISQGAASTVQMTDAVLGKLSARPANRQMHRGTARNSPESAPRIATEILMTVAIGNSQRRSRALRHGDPLRLARAH